MADIFLQHYEHTHIKHLLEKQTIIFYNTYVDNIFIIYDSNNITINEIQQQTKRIHKNLEFKLTTENNNDIEYLDLLITRLQRKIDMDIFRKPTTRDITIHSTSNHPLEHKLAAYRYYLYRLNTFPLTEDNKKKEFNNIKHIA